MAGQFAAPSEAPRGELAVRTHHKRRSDFSDKIGTLRARTKAWARSAPAQDQHLVILGLREVWARGRE